MDYILKVRWSISTWRTCFSPRLWGPRQWRRPVIAKDSGYGPSFPLGEGGGLFVENASRFWLSVGAF